MRAPRGSDPEDVGPHRRPRLRYLAAISLVAVSLGLAVVGCSGDDGGDGGDSNFPEGTSDAGVRGRALIVQSGCVACHNTDGSKTSGPTWKGLAGSEVPLADGRTVVADDTYLANSIIAPKSEIRAGYVGVMPEYLQLTDQQIADMVTYIRELPTD